MDEKQFETIDGITLLREDGIVEVRHKPGQVQTLESAMATFAAIRRLAGDRLPVPLLVVMGEMKGQTGEARRYLSKDPIITESITAIALVVSTPVGRVMGNMFIGFRKHELELKIFNSEEKAVEWLNVFAGVETDPG